MIVGKPTDRKLAGRLRYPAQGAADVWAKRCSGWNGRVAQDSVAGLRDRLEVM